MTLALPSRAVQEINALRRGQGLEEVRLSRTLTRAAARVLPDLGDWQEDRPFLASENQALLGAIRHLRTVSEILAYKVTFVGTALELEERIQRARPSIRQALLGDYVCAGAGVHLRPDRTELLVLLAKAEP